MHIMNNIFDADKREKVRFDIIINEPSCSVYVCVSVDVHYRPLTTQTRQIVLANKIAEEASAVQNDSRPTKPFNFDKSQSFFYHLSLSLSLSQWYHSFNW